MIPKRKKLQRRRRTSLGERGNQVKKENIKKNGVIGTLTIAGKKKNIVNQRGHHQRRERCLFQDEKED